MKTTGKKNLINNDYNEITLIENDNKIECVITAEKKKKSGILIGNFEKELDKEQNDSKKALLIVNYFLENSNISQINQFVRLNDDNRQFLIVKSNDRKLNLSLSTDNYFGGEIIEQIMDKYQIDRYKSIYDILEQVDVINLIPSYDVAGYEIIKSNNSLILNLSYLKSIKGIYAFEDIFIEDLLEEYINIKNEKAINYKNDSRPYFKAIRQIQIGSSQINILESKLRENDKQFIGAVDSIINKYSQKNKSEKIKQMKLEGF